MSIVSKEEYWTTILNDYSQFGQITTEDSEFNSIANDVWSVLENSFIKIDDEESIIKWEEMAGLSGEGLTIFQRKVNILYTLTIKNYLPISLFTQAMDRLVGEDNYFIIFDEDTQKYKVETYEVHETSASFLNKRLANESVELEISSLPSGYLAAEFLESTGTQYINTGLIATESTEFEAEAAIMSTNGAVLGQNNVNYQSGYYCVRANGNLYMRAGSQEFSFGTQYASGEKTIFFKKDGKIGFGNISQNLSAESYTGKASLFLFARRSNSNGVDYAGTTRFWHINMADNGKEYKLVATIDKNGTPCMFDKVTRKPFYNNGTGQFIVGMTIEQARKLGRLPSMGGLLTISLPWEAQLVQYNAKAEAALQTAKNKGWTITVQYRDPESDSAIHNKYATCKTVADMVAINPDYRNDLTNDDEWIYPLPNLTSVPMTTATGEWWFRNSPIKKIDIELPKLTQGQYLFRGSAMEEARVSLPLLTTNQRSMFEGCPLRVAHVNAPNLTNLSALFASTQMEEITEENLNVGEAYDISYIALNTPKLRRFAFPCLHVTNADYAFIGSNNLTSFESELPKLSSGTVMFQDCQLNKESALRVLTSIPTWTDGEAHKITMGIHIDNKNDEEVLAAIENAKNKGWTVVTQWRGTATTQGASTFAMRKPTIYAKLGTMELPDGTIETFLDWGHYVTNAEENGYQEFSSIEEANEYFNIESETEQ